MTVYEIPNINHCTVEGIGNPAFMYRIIAHEGWYIHLNDESTENIYKGAVALRTDFDFTKVEIIPESELPEGAEILGDVTEPETEEM